MIETEGLHVTILNFYSYMGAPQFHIHIRYQWFLTLPFCTVTCVTQLLRTLHHINEIFMFGVPIN